MKSIIESIKKGIGLGIGMAIGLLGGSLVAVTISSFSDGETLTASKLNDNFNALKVAVEAFGPRYGIADTNGNKAADVTVRGNLSSTGFNLSIFDMTLNYTTGEYGRYNKLSTYYTTNDCTGAPYFVNTSPKTVYYAANGSFYYIPATPTVITITVQSATFPGSNSCIPSSGSYYVSQPIANDPSTTGFNPSSYTTPYKYITL